MNFITLHNINKKYKSKNQAIIALDEVSLSINKGSISGIIGKSGAGKSTLLRTINLLDLPDSGKVIIDNEDILKKDKVQLRQLRSQISMIFQHFNLLQTKTVEQNILFPLQFLQNRNHSLEKKIFDSIIEITELKDLLEKYPSQLSGGQKQRVAIARALITNPKILLSDEATSALDPQNTKIILNLLKKINKDLNITIVLITHEMEVISSICDTVFIIEQGKIVEQGNTVNLFANPKTQAAKELLGFNTWLNLPENILSKISQEFFTNSNPLIKLSFLHNAAVKPIIYNLQKEYNLEINILQGDIKTISQEIIGTMLIKINNLDNRNLNLDDLIQVLNKLEVTSEIIGYVPRDL